MSILTYLIISGSIQTFNCQDEISLKFKIFLEDMNETHYEMFNRFDIDDNQCIDFSEMNTLLRKIGVSWRCRWVQKTIHYFDTLKINNCVEWSEFKNKMLNYITFHHQS